MKRSLLTLAAIVMALSIQAQQQKKLPARKSFEEFRKGLHDDYNSFRKGIIDRYADFLDGVWSDYEQFKGEEADSKPKPKVAPVADGYVPAEHPAPVVTIQPALPPKEPARPAKPVLPVIPEPSPRPEFGFNFYEIPLSMPETNIKLAMRMDGTKDYASQWRKLAKDPEAQILIREVERKAAELGLNDYLKYELASSYIDARYSGASPSSRMSLKHFILTNMGYGVRLGINGHGRALLLVPCRQSVYARMFIRIDGTKYYVFGTDDNDPSVMANATISTCDLPKNNDPGIPMDLRINGLKLPYTPHRFDLSFRDLKISGEVNAAIFPVLYRYPQMPTADFARSSVCQEVRDSIVAQFKAQLGGKDERTAVDQLLQFVQGAFEYATDDEFHGFEKPYFFEETLFYPKCDCEDRAIFYTYLLWHVLGVENHLINYPGHESASVKLSSPIKGDAYQYEGSTFYISDPTFIGARTGMCMPNYINDSPGVDYHYK